MQVHPPAAPDQAHLAPAGQRRYVTVLFSDVSDSSRHAELLEAEEYAELLGRFRQFAREIIPRHGGSIARLQGDGLLALFGHLETREDDGRRAAEAALQLHAAVGQLQVGTGAHATVLQMHSGIHGGLVLLIEGDIERGRYDVVGEVPNTAARLCSLAASAEILASAETLGPQVNFFRIQAHGQTPIRGRSAPLDVLRIEGRRDLARRIDAGVQRDAAGFVGREAELSAMFLLAEQARLGRPSMAHLVGEPGIGKTRLVEEFLRRLDRSYFQLLQGYCENYLGAQALQPFIHIMRAACGGRAGASPGENEAAMLAALRAWGAGPRSELALRTRQFLSLDAPAAAAGGLRPDARVATFMEVLALAAREQTLVLVLDDWQWADDASRHVLQALLARQLPIMLLIASRPLDEEDPQLAGAKSLPLQPLDGQESARVIAARLPHMEPFALQDIFLQSGGSPLFIEELCLAAAAHGTLQATPRRAGAAWINALVASRLARLSDEQTGFLRVAAVLGTVFPVALIETVLGAQVAARAYASLASHEFLVPAAQSGMLRFKHALTREAVYATLDLKHRRALHLSVAQTLEAALQSATGGAALDGDVEGLSYHYDAAGIKERAAHFAEAAGDRALHNMALDRGRAQYLTALKSLDALPALDRPLRLRWCAIAQKLGQTCVFDALDVSHGLVYFERAARLAREAADANATARAEYWLGYVNYGKGQARQAVHHCQAALEYALQSNDQRLVAQVQATLGQSLAAAGRYEQALPLLQQAVESKRQHSRPGSGTAIGSAYSLARLAYSLGDQGHFEQAHQHFGEALSLLGDNSHAVSASIHELVCAVHLWQGRWEEARAEGQLGAEIALRCRSRFNTAMGRALAACAAWAADADPAALQTLRDATDWIAVRGGAVSTSLNYGWLVEACMAQGLLPEARQHAAQLFQRARAQDRHGLAQGCRAMARMAMEQGHGRRTLHYLGVAEQAASARSSARESALNRFAQAQWALHQGQGARARDLAQRAGEALDRMHMAWHAAQVRQFQLRL